MAASADSAPRGAGAGPVDHQPGQRHPVLAEPLDEVRRLAQRVRLRRGDDEERRAVGLEQLERLLRALPEAAEERVEGGHEGLHVAQHLRAEDLGQRVGDQAEPGGHQPGRPARRGEQQPDEPAVEEAREPLGRVEEVERRARGRGVDDDQVVAAVAPGVARGSGPASPSPCTPGCPRTSSTARRRRGSPGSAAPSRGWPGSPPPRRRCASCRASSRRARPPCAVVDADAPGAGCCRAPRCPSTARGGAPGRW